MCNPYKILGLLMAAFALGGLFVWQLGTFPSRPRRRKLRVLKGGRKK